MIDGQKESPPTMWDAHSGRVTFISYRLVDYKLVSNISNWLFHFEFHELYIPQMSVLLRLGILQLAAFVLPARFLMYNN